jgi:16S rRNA (uracil1498-N3)-methyltransferase
MTEPRLLVDAGLAAGSACPLSSAQAHYLGTVLRRRPGSGLRLFNGRDGEWLARLINLRRDRAEVLVEHQIRVQAGEDVDLWLVFALLKRDATDLVVQKATELGVSRMVPVVTERTNAGRVNEGRLAAIAAEAAEQSERLTVPVIEKVRPLAAVLACWPSNRALFAAVERAPDLPPVRPARGPSGLLIGPEGGFTVPELDGFRDHPLVTRVQLGSRILRAETACLAGLVLLQAPGCG